MYPPFLKQSKRAERCLTRYADGKTTLFSPLIPIAGRSERA